ncbi:MAG TPA: twin-arginine translocase TatA/TatE family subunit [Anaerolineae bacterium]|nr:twin-arginine translocase TatA/TatE family subunit [Anaerolineae bacterium]
MNFLGIGPWELILILVIALLVFGPRRLPEIGRALGRTIAEFRRMSQELAAEMAQELEAEPPQKAEEAEGASGEELAG